MRPTPKTLLPALPILAISLTLAACGGSSSSYSSTGSNAAATASTAPATAATTASTPSAAASGGAGAAGVKTASNAALGSTVLVSPQGKTLYHLSGEGNGKFLCTSAACVGVWPPVSVSASATSAGVSGLSAVKRPDASEQLAYNGEPLYTFSGDRAAGEANGQGIKADGGTWSAVVAGAGGASAAPSGGSGGEGAAGAGAGGESGSSGGSGAGGGYKY